MHNLIFVNLFLILVDVIITCIQKNISTITTARNVCKTSTIAKWLEKKDRNSINNNVNLRREVTPCSSFSGAVSFCQQLRECCRSRTYSGFCSYVARPLCLLLPTEGLGTFLEVNSETFLACEKNEMTESYSHLYVHTSQPLILFHGWLFVILLIRELSKKTSGKCKQILLHAEEGHPVQ